MDEQLTELRNEWERSMTEVAVSKSEFLVAAVLKDKQGRYHCHRYFTIGGEWTVSADYQGLSDPEAVMRWLAETLK